jgi:phosphoribosylformylglycinamidine synthase PurS subunit
MRSLPLTFYRLAIDLSFRYFLKVITIWIEIWAIDTTDEPTKFINPATKRKISIILGVRAIAQTLPLAKQQQMKFKAQVYVTLRPSVLDPAGTAVQSAMQQMDYHVESVRIGKYIEVLLDADSEATAKEQLDQVCDRLLANPVIENYCFELTKLELVEAG